MRNTIDAKISPPASTIRTQSGIPVLLKALISAGANASKHASVKTTSPKDHCNPRRAALFCILMPGFQTRAGASDDGVTLFPSGDGLRSNRGQDRKTSSTLVFAPALPD